MCMVVALKLIRDHEIDHRIRERIGVMLEECFPDAAFRPTVRT